MSDETEQRRNSVLAILQAAAEPIGPTEIARRIGKSWCNRNFGSRKPSPQSNAINPLLATLVADGTVQRLPKGLYQIAVARPKSSATQTTGPVLSASEPRGRR